MPRISSMPCKVPSSPGRPCKTLSATSGLIARSVAATSRSTSTRLTWWPVRSSASAQALPERNDTSRSADQPPIRTVTCFIILAFHSDSLDFPFQIDTGMRLHPLPHGFAQRLDVSRAGAAKIDQEIAVEFGHLRSTDGEPAAAGVIHQFPGAMARRIFKRGAASAIARLARLALLLDSSHFRSDLIRDAGVTLQHRSCENDIVRHATMAIGKSHVAIAERTHIALPVDTARFDKNIFGFATIGTTVHAQGTPDSSGNAA